ncbi:MAG TPA: hypothetical protein VGQ75_11255 [Thermoanaerobaculia bacterium]|jgi:hypothetical protein|nr:hypothetical protein [Thermoanaerobaculia bacterium]HEV8609551.1 hypothetical protein [Thermoanaerobaculia bacterium]
MTERDDDVPPETPDPAATPAAPAASGVRSEAASPAGRRPSRPNLSIERIAVSRDHAGYAFRLEPSDLANLRELPGARGKTDEELGAEFLEAQCDRLVAAIAGDLPAPAAIRVLVDPYSRQAFLAHEDRVRGIVSF